MVEERGRDGCSRLLVFGMFISLLLAVLSSMAGSSFPLPALPDLSGIGQALGVAPQERGTLAYDDEQSDVALTYGAGDRWTFAGTRGDVITIVVDGSFDSVLRLIAPDGAEIAQDDDSGSGSNPRLDDVTLPDTGTYALVLSGYSGATGTYALEVRLEVAGFGASPQARGAIDRGATVNATLTTADGDAWTFDGSLGQRVTLSAESDAFDVLIVVLGPDGVIVGDDDDGGSGTNARVDVVLPSSGTYTVVVQGKEGATGDYAVEVSD